MNRQILLLIFSAIYLPLTAQETLTTDEVLAYHDSLLTASAQNTAFDDFIGKSKNEISAIEKMEFRTETDRWDVARQEYTMRTSLKNKGELVGEQNVLNSWEKIISLEHEEVRQNRFFNLYEQLIDLLSLQQMETVVRDLLAVAEDRRSVLLSKIGFDSRLSTSEVLKVEEEILDLQLDLTKLEGRATSIIKQIAKSESSDIRLDFSSWMTVTDLKTAFTTLMTNEGIPLSLLKQKEELGLKQVELGKEKAKGGRVLDFLQLKYSANENIVNGNQLSVGVSVILPSGHANKENIREANIDVFREEIQSKIRSEEVSRDQAVVIFDFKEVESQWDLLTKKLAEQDLQGTLQKLVKTEGVRAKTLLDVKEMILARQLHQLKIEKSMYVKYLELSELKGKLGGVSACQIFNNK